MAAVDSRPPDHVEQLLLNYSTRAKNGCLVWTRATTPMGYGVIRLHQKNEYVHRLAYLLWVGEIPTRHHIHHRCHTRACFEPTHLIAVSPREHGKQHEKEHCARGHSMADAYLVKIGDRKRRVCRSCHNLRRKGLHHAA